MSIKHSTNFDSDTLGALPTGWSAKSGASWAVVDTGFVSSPYALDAASDGHFVTYEGSSAIADSKFSCQFKLTATNWNPPGPAIRMNNAFTTGYLLIAGAQFVPGAGAGSFDLYIRSGGSWGGAGNLPITIAGSPVNGDTCNLEFKAVGNVLTVTLWKDGTTQPTSGTGFATITDSTVSTAGFPGFYRYTNGGQPGLPVDNFAWDDLAAGATYDVTGPSGGVAGVASTNFTIQVTGTLGASTIFTPSDGGAGGSFTPSTVTLSGTSPSGTFTYTPSSAGVKTITVNNDQGLTVPATDSYTATGVATSYTLTGPSSGSVGSPSTNFTITISGTTIGSTIFTPSDGGGGGTFTPTTVTINAGTNGSGTFTYTPASSGAKTISTSDNGGLTDPSPLTYTASTGPMTIPVSDSTINWAPGAWDTIQIGTYGVSVLSKQSATPGCYLKFKVAACTDVSIILDPTIANAISSGNRPKLTYAVNGGERVTVQIVAQTSIALLSGASSADRIFEIFGMFTQDSGGTRYSQVAGTSLSNGIRVQGLEINAGASMATYPFTQTKKIVIWGDSITEGTYAGSGWNNVSPVDANTDPLSAYPASLAMALGAEYAQLGFGGQGWSASGSAGINFLSTWDKFSVDRPRDLSGFDYALVFHGTNDGMNYAGASTVQSWIGSCRTALGAGKWIFVATPPGGYAKTALDTAVTDYNAANPSDTYVKRIDFSDMLDTKYFSIAQSLYTADAWHPNAYGHARIAGAMSYKINGFIGGGSPTPVPDPLWDSILEGTLTASDMMRIMFSVMAGATTISQVGADVVVKFKSQDGLTDRVSATMTGSERTAVTVEGA